MFVQPELTTTAGFAALTGHDYMSLVTYRSSGAGVATPVWFAQDGDTLYMMTMAQSGKVKRIRQNANVAVTPCDRDGKLLGPTIAGVARLLNSTEAETALNALDAKYGNVRARLMRGELGGVNARVYLAITPHTS